MLCVQQSYDILLLVLMGLLLVQAVLTLATIVKCASYKSQLRTEWDTLHKKHSEVKSQAYTLWNDWQVNLRVQEVCCTVCVLYDCAQDVSHERLINEKLYCTVPNVAWKTVTVEWQSCFTTVISSKCTWRMLWLTKEDLKVTIGPFCFYHLILFLQQQTLNGTLRDFDREKAWKAVVVQMAQWPKTQPSEGKNREKESDGTNMEYDNVSWTRIIMELLS